MMKIKLSENIRSFRKARSLTQQQLADALGVTVGAVYKWEAGLSAPDLSLLVELADLFDTSVDVLLDYEVKSNKQSATVARLKQFMHERDERGLVEAEKALVRYPNAFEVVYQSAILYNTFGLIKHDERSTRRSIELLEGSVLLIGQNTDPKVSELSIYTEIAIAYLNIGESEKAVELLKKHNPCGINDALIGQALASVCDRPEDAIPHLSMALLRNVEGVSHIVMGYMNVFFKQKKFAAAVDAVEWALSYYGGLRVSGQTGFFDKLIGILLVALAAAHLELGHFPEAREALRKAKTEAERFDRSPAYNADSIRFVFIHEPKTVYDDIGESAMEGVRIAVRSIDNATLSALWEEVDHEG